VFNCVPACEECNLSKSNKLPKENIFDKVVARNEKIKTPLNYSKEWYEKLYKDCLMEYHGTRKFFEPKS